MIRKHIIAHGRVQGVGLRFTVTGFAKKYNVTGWVRNLYDGTSSALTNWTLQIFLL